MKPERIRKAALFLYSGVMLWLLFDRPGFAEGIPYWDQVRAQLNLVPFRTLRLFAGLLDSARPEYVRAAVVNLFGNVIMFIPLGLLLPLAFSRIRTFWQVLLISSAAIILVELIQLFTLVGSCDIDDLILNLIGATLGYGFWNNRFDHE